MLKYKEADASEILAVNLAIYTVFMVRHEVQIN
jgi:hypothetical protein